MYSLAQGHFAIPKLWKANKAQIEGVKLVEKKEMIKLLYERMNEKVLRNDNRNH